MPDIRSDPLTAICLFSGGLDSRLAAGLMLEQGVRLIALHFTSVFLPESSPNHVSSVEEAARELGMELRIMDISDEQIRLVENPPHGYGSGLNPCIDCRILQLRTAHVLMKKTRSAFLVTGEVLGQRPMTQKKDMMRHIDIEAGVAGLVLRPLSAQLLEPTMPEMKGYADRERLYAFSGRQRTPQIKLAEKLRISNYPPPAGGCRLTDPGYARRIGDLLHHGQLCPENILLLTVGRHFRMDENTRLIVGREEEENCLLIAAAMTSDTLLECVGFPGPTSLLRGNCSEENLHTAARITARYGKGRCCEQIPVKASGSSETVLDVHPAGSDEFADIII